jgi:adenosine kinase
VRALIVTRGAEGSWIFADGRRLEIPIAPPEAVVDPTGCGDAYRAGLLFGIERGLDWESSGRVAALLASIKLARHGTQQHRCSPGEFRDRFSAAFGYAL